MKPGPYTKLGISVIAVPFLTALLLLIAMDVVRSRKDEIQRQTLAREETKRIGAEQDRERRLDDFVASLRRSSKDSTGLMTFRPLNSLPNPQEVENAIGPPDYSEHREGLITYMYLVYYPTSKGALVSGEPTSTGARLGPPVEGTDDHSKKYLYVKSARNAYDFVFGSDGRMEAQANPNDLSSYRVYRLIVWHKQGALRYGFSKIDSDSEYDWPLSDDATPAELFGTKLAFGNR